MKGLAMRFIVNLLLKTLVILGLNWLGWITLMSDGEPIGNDTKKLVGTAIVVAAIFLVVAVLLALLSFGLAALLTVFFGGVVLLLVGKLAPDFVILHNFWLTLIGGFVILAAELPKQRKRELQRITM